MRLGLLYMLPLLSRRFASSRTVARRMASLSEVEHGAAGARCMVDKLLSPPKIPVADLGLAQEDRAAARHAFQRRVFDDAFAGRRTPRVVSVVGTKGKGSCSELLRAALHEDAKYGAVGCFTSPHLHGCRERVRVGAAGGLADPRFLRSVQPLYDLHMGAENLGPMLYNLVRFTKPGRILEVGAGYTSAFLLQALADNAAELEAYRRLRRDGLAVCGDAPWSVDAFFDREAGDGGGRYRGDDDSERSALRSGVDGVNDRRSAPMRAPDPNRLSAGGRAASSAPSPGSEDARVDSGVLHCLDNLAHEHTTAHLLVETAKKMGCADRLRLHNSDAFDPDLPSTLEPGVEFDMLWIDLGAAHRIEGFFEAWWPRVRAEGGMVVVHSTLTNALSRGWLERMRELARAPEPCAAYGRFETMSLLEPHKMFQNAITMFQKRGGAFGRYDEPVHTKFP